MSTHPITQGRHRAPSVVIEPTAGAVRPQLRAAWQDRELLYFLTLRDVKARFAQTVLGWLWAIVQPLGMTLVFTFAFSKLGKVETDGIAYPVFAFVGLAFWTFFSRAVTTAADSLITNTPLLTKTACPRLLMPLSAIASACFDLLIAMAVMFVVVLAYGEDLSWRLAVLPVIVAYGVLLATGMGIGLAAINVQRRDVRNGLPFAMQLLLFISPIAYSLGALGTGVTLVSLNPIVGLIEAFRWAVVATPPPAAGSLAISLSLTALFLFFGLKYFSRVARDFADVA
jgi:lipopolysaccharide transport system permease protein